MSHELYDDASSAPRTLSPEAALHVALQARTDERDAARAELAEVRAEIESLRMLTDHGALADALAELERLRTLTTPGQGVSAPATAGPVSLAGARPAAVDAGHPACTRL